MPKTATPRKPETVSRKLAETRNTAKNRSLSSLLGIGDNEKRLATDFGSGLNDVIGRGTIAGLLGLPGDLGGAAENGLRSLLGLPQVTPYGGSEHIGQKLEQAGLVSSERRPKTELLASLISPAQVATAGYKAPQMARAGVKALDNLTAPRTMGRQQGAIYNIFHGTTPEAAASIEKNGFDLNKSADGSIWFTSNPEIGEVAASGKGGIVQRSLDDQAMRLGGWDEADKYGVDELLQQGYDGLKLDDGEETVYQIFNPQKLGNGQPVGNLGKMVAPQDEALRVAQANAAKPVEEGGLGLRPDNTPEERAAAMGFDIQGFRGTNADERFARASSGMVGKAHYSGIDPEAGEIYADGVGANMMPLLIKGPLAGHKMKDAVINEHGWGSLADELRNRGYSGVIDDRYEDANAVMDTTKVRSRFAAFDPMRRDSSDLLAGIAPFGAVPWLYEDK